MTSWYPCMADNAVTHRACSCLIRCPSQAGAPVSSLATCRTYIAAGTTAGTVRVWRRQSPSDPSYEQCITPDIVLDTRPIYGVWFRPLRAPKTAAAGGAAGGGGGAGAGGGEDTVLVVHAYGSGRVGAWRMVRHLTT